MKVIVFVDGTEIVGHESDIRERDIHCWRNYHHSRHYGKAQEPSVLWTLERKNTHKQIQLCFACF